MRAFSVLLLAFFVGQQVPAPALTEDVVIDLVRRAPAFGPSSSGAGLTVVRMMAIPASQDRGYFAEISWREGEQYRGALLSIARTDVDPPPDMTWVVRHQRWGILHIEVDKTWQDLINQLENARMSSSESAAIGRLRAMASGQATFAAVAGGGYSGELRCRLKPATCGIESAVGFIDDSFQDAERSGYRFTLHPGAALPSKAGGRVFLQSYAYTAEPITVAVTGRRSFCSDDTGTLCEHSDGAPFEIRNGACPAACSPVK
jgi:hypothetical protein